MSNIPNLKESKYLCTNFQYVYSTSVNSNTSSYTTRIKQIDQEGTTKNTTFQVADTELGNKQRYKNINSAKHRNKQNLEPLIRNFYEYHIVWGVVREIPM